MQSIEVSNNDYEPSEKDILFSEGVTQGNGLAIIDFSLDDRSSATAPYDDNSSDFASHSLTKYASPIDDDRSIIL